ncbi:MAG TPA: 4-(cytidine 5'-diphospho)-2-C-methyl-D-erythritol kinase [Opitutaceae bacterium]|nr:4-(cytidine 5'-diphospho)-2-C-methyl-D-erythritol kinase [Opitutaceae bacterium]
MPTLRLFAPAKINLFLAITGRRPDGFHDLISVGAPLDFGDELHVEPRPDELYSFSCDSSEVPTDDSNLVVKAARLFRESGGTGPGANLRLIKRTPVGAGLGGGSSDAAAVLLGLNELSDRPFDEAKLIELAARLGSDCPLFIEGKPCVMRGRGERIQTLGTDLAARLKGRRVLLFKPSFGISTVWAYRAMAAAAPAHYLPTEQAEARLENWQNDPSAPLENLLFNNMEGVAFAKFVALPTLLEKLHRRFGVAVRMSGSGSACFALLREQDPVAEIVACIREAFGPTAFVAEAQIR